MSTDIDIGYENRTLLEYDLDDSMDSTSWFIAIFVGANYILYIILFLIGLPTNLFVLAKMLRLKRRKPDAFRCGTGMCLLTMAVADALALIAIVTLCVISFRMIPLPHVITDYGAVMCKMSIFTMHAATSIAIWSWLLMSILRWLALYYPLVHRTLYDLPLRLLGLVVAISCLTNSWLLVTVKFNNENMEEPGCVPDSLLGSERLTRVILLVETGWSFIVPIMVVAYLDTAALISIPKILKASSSLKSAHQPRLSLDDCFHKKCKRTLARWLLIALIDILLNAPENLLRLNRILSIVAIDDSQLSYVVVKMTSDLLYYSQYSFNALYLALFIYDKCTTSDGPVIQSAVMDRSRGPSRKGQHGGRAAYEHVIGKIDDRPPSSECAPLSEKELMLSSV